MRKIEIKSVENGTIITETDVLGNVKLPRQYTLSSGLKLISSAYNRLHKDLGLQTYRVVTSDGSSAFIPCLASEIEFIDKLGTSYIPTDLNILELSKNIEGLVPLSGSSGGGGSTDLTPVVDMIEEVRVILTEPMTPTSQPDLQLTAGTYDKAGLITALTTAGYTDTKVLIHQLQVELIEGTYFELQSANTGDDIKYNGRETVSGNTKLGKLEEIADFTLIVPADATVIVRLIMY